MTLPLECKHASKLFPNSTQKGGSRSTNPVSENMDYTDVRELRFSPQCQSLFDLSSKMVNCQTPESREKVAVKSGSVQINEVKSSTNINTSQDKNKREGSVDVDLFNVKSQHDKTEENGGGASTTDNRKDARSPANNALSPKKQTTTEDGKAPTKEKEPRSKPSDANKKTSLQRTRLSKEVQTCNTQETVDNLPKKSDRSNASHKAMVPKQFQSRREPNKRKKNDRQTTSLRGTKKKDAKTTTTTCEGSKEQIKSTLNQSIIRKTNRRKGKNADGKGDGVDEKDPKDVAAAQKKSMETPSKLRRALSTNEEPTKTLDKQEEADGDQDEEKEENTLDHCQSFRVDPDLRETFEKMKGGKKSE